MSEDRMGADEPLISTDVDQMIRTLADRKRVPLNELRQLCKIDKKTMDKWIAVLEDEGYITVEYGLRGTNILWKEVEEPLTPAQPVTEATVEAEQVVEEPQEAVFSEVPHPKPLGRPGDVEEAPAGETPAEEFTAEVEVQEEPEPEELLSQYLARKKGGNAERDVSSIKSSILTNLEEEKGEETVAPPPEEPEEPEAPEISEEAEAEAGEEREPEEVRAPVQPPKMKQTIRPTKPAADVRELMGSYMDEINREKAKVETLKKEKEDLYRDKLATMEGKLQADIVVLTEKVIEKESKIAELKERVLELPDKVDELSKLQEQLETLKKEGRDALARTRAKAEEFLVGVQESKEKVGQKVEKVEIVIGSQDSKVRELEKLNESLGTRSEKIKAALDSSKAQLEEVQSAISALSEDLGKVEEAREEVLSMTDEIRQTVAGHGDELKSLEDELEGISRVEKWVQEYIRDYEHKIGDLEQYVAKSEDEIAELREAAEGLYIKKYLGELEDITDSYESELDGAVAREREIEQKMSQSKARITELVRESQEMIRRLRTEVPEEATEKDFGVLVAKVKARTARAKNVVVEKVQERAKLAEDSRKTRKTQKPAQRAKAAPKKVKAKPAPAKKRK
ncbi:MAG: hypothetical protein AB1324_02070 [Candidatus Micrarchaeota archaeon]